MKSKLISCICMVSSSLIIGGCIGYKIHTKEIDNKLDYLLKMYELIKQKNNTFLTNFMTIYSQQNETEGIYTDMDERIRSMWMD